VFRIKHAEDSTGRTGGCGKLQVVLLCGCHPFRGVRTPAGSFAPVAVGSQPHPGKDALMRPFGGADLRPARSCISSRPRSEQFADEQFVRTWSYGEGQHRTICPWGVAMNVVGDRGLPRAAPTQDQQISRALRADSRARRSASSSATLRPESAPDSSPIKPCSSTKLARRSVVSFSFSM